MEPDDPQAHAVLRTGRGLRRALSGLRHPAAGQPSAQVEVIPGQCRWAWRDGGLAIWADDSTTETPDITVDAAASESRFLEEALGNSGRTAHYDLKRRRPICCQNHPLGASIA